MVTCGECGHNDYAMDDMAWNDDDVMWVCIDCANMAHNDDGRACVYCGGTINTCMYWVHDDAYIFMHQTCKHMDDMREDHVHAFPSLVHGDDCPTPCTIECHDNHACMLPCDCVSCKDDNIKLMFAFID